MHLIELSANGNKIISNYADECLFHVVEKVKLPKTLARVATIIQNNKSKVI